MALFGKTEINPKILPFIQNGSGVGVVKVGGVGNYSMRIESDKILLDPYDNAHPPIAVAIASIKRISYDKGNFIMEPKLYVDTDRDALVFAGVDNNDAELERFYNTLLSIKTNEEMANNNTQQNLNNNMMTNRNNNTVNPASSVSPADESADAVDEIRRYYQLKEDGIITEEEFEEKKKQLLGI